MELTYDWRSFQAVFYPQKRSFTAHPTQGTLFAIVDNNTVVSIYCDGESFSDYVGSSVQSLRGVLNGRDLVVLDCADVDQWMNGALSLSHLHEQVEFFRKSASPKLESKVRASLRKQTCLSERHFLLDTLLGKWNKALPSAFGVFIRLEKAQPNYVVPEQLMDILGNRCKEYLDEEQDILVLIRAGKIEAFYEPDLNPLGAERRLVCADVVKYLSEKHSVPVQGLSLPYIEWIAWNHDNKPWRQFASCLKSRTAKLSPMRWQTTALIGLRAATDFGKSN